MGRCIDLPYLGQKCILDMTIHVGGYNINLLHPGVIMTAVLAAVMIIFIFRSPT